MLVQASQNEGFTVPEGTPIVAIRVVRHNVFDVDKPETSAWPYRAANALHVVSRESFIRSLLLFKEGEPLNSALLAESERLLRATGFLNPVSITAAVGEGGAEVVVETFDQWTLDLDVSFGIHGARRRSGLAIEDSNFLGFGKELLLDWRRDQERNSVTLGYLDPVFWGTRWRLAFRHVEASDGGGDEFRLEYPFFALSTPFAGGLRVSQEDRTSWLYAGGKKQVSGHVSRHAARVWAGMRLPSWEPNHDRLIVGLFTDRVSYDDWSWLAGGALERPVPGCPGVSLVAAAGGPCPRPELERARRGIVAGAGRRWVAAVGARQRSRRFPARPPLHLARGDGLWETGGGPNSRRRTQRRGSGNNDR